ncbi:MAG: TIGR00282 family metallophosphoesterase [Patescibacteria group bacterium]
MNILFFGDVIGRPGREALRYIIPLWKKEYAPDIVIANGENISHGKGISERTIKELLDSGVDVITSGNHATSGPGALELLKDEKLPLLRPINFLPHIPGRGFLVKTVNDKKLLIVNAIGNVHMRKVYQFPFPMIDALIAEHPGIKHIFLDWHAEATSEKVAMGWHVDGRVSVVVGSHTHTPTADERILPKGTGFISDVGMVGPHHSVIGEDIKLNLERLLSQTHGKADMAEAPPYEINAVFIELDEETGKTLAIRRLREIVDKPLS